MGELEDKLFEGGGRLFSSWKFWRRLFIFIISFGFVFSLVFTGVQPRVLGAEIKYDETELILVGNSLDDKARLYIGPVAFPGGGRSEGGGFLVTEISDINSTETKWNYTSYEQWHSAKANCKSGGCLTDLSNAYLAKGANATFGENDFILDDSGNRLYYIFTDGEGIIIDRSSIKIGPFADVYIGDRVVFKASNKIDLLNGVNIDARGQNGESIKGEGEPVGRGNVGATVVLGGAGGSRGGNSPKSDISLRYGNPATGFNDNGDERINCGDTASQCPYEGTNVLKGASEPIRSEFTSPIKGILKGGDGSNGEDNAPRGATAPDVRGGDGTLGEIGAGGGGGSGATGETGGADSSGAGGGGGGYGVKFSSPSGSIRIEGGTTIDVRGGDGGYALRGGSEDSGGNGGSGGGGVIYINGANLDLETGLRPPDNRRPIIEDQSKIKGGHMGFKHFRDYMNNQRLTIGVPPTSPNFNLEKPGGDGQLVIEKSGSQTQIIKEAGILTGLPADGTIAPTVQSGGDVTVRIKVSNPTDSALSGLTIKDNFFKDSSDNSWILVNKGNSNRQPPDVPEGTIEWDISSLSGGTTQTLWYVLKASY